MNNAYNEGIRTTPFMLKLFLAALQLSELMATALASSKKLTFSMMSWFKFLA